MKIPLEIIEECEGDIFGYIERNLNPNVYIKDPTSWKKNFEYVLDCIDEEAIQFGDDEKGISALLHVLFLTKDMHNKGEVVLMADILEKNESETIYPLIIDRLKEYRDRDEDFKDQEILLMINDFL